MKRVVDGHFIKQLLCTISEIYRAVNILGMKYVAQKLTLGEMIARLN